MEHKFLFSDLVLFFRIIKKDIGIELPDYISKIESHDVKKYYQMFKAYLRRQGQPTIHM